MYIINTTSHPIPCPPLTDAEKDRLSDLQRRSADRRVQAGEKALTAEERRELNEMQARWADTYTPYFAGVHYHFAAHGEQGCVISTLGAAARHLSQRYGGRLRILREGEVLPDGVTPVPGPRLPSANELQYGVDDKRKLARPMSRVLADEFANLGDPSTVEFDDQGISVPESAWAPRG